MSQKPICVPSRSGPVLTTTRSRLLPAPSERGLAIQIHSTSGTKHCGYRHDREAGGRSPQSCCKHHAHVALSVRPCLWRRSFIQHLSRGSRGINSDSRVSRASFRSPSGIYNMSHPNSCSEHALGAGLEGRC
jgi:hypothetical protein